MMSGHGRMELRLGCGESLYSRWGRPGLAGAQVPPTVAMPRRPRAPIEPSGPAAWVRIWPGRGA
jgi:hypothetical protein